MGSKGDWWSEVFLRKLGITWKSKTQWFWVRNLILHLPAGLVVGLFCWFVTGVLSAPGYVWSIVGGILFTTVLWMEAKDQKQSKWKRAFDVVFWLIGFMSVWVLKEVV